MLLSRLDLEKKASNLWIWPSKGLLSSSEVKSSSHFISGLQMRKVIRGQHLPPYGAHTSYKMNTNYAYENIKISLVYF